METEDFGIVFEKIDEMSGIEQGDLVNDSLGILQEDIQAIIELSELSDEYSSMEYSLFTTT